MPTPPTPATSLKPLVKWAGGKRSEIPRLKPLYPARIDRVIEPFAGGAAVALDLNAPATLLNDVAGGLVDFYRCMGVARERGRMLARIGQVDKARKNINQAVAGLSDSQLAGACKDLDGWIDRSCGAWLKEFDAHWVATVVSDMKAGAKSKIGPRLAGLEKKHGRTFSADERRAMLASGLQAGVYTTLRRIYNGKIQGVGPDWQVASWWIVRSLCYSGMFRYGRNGDFNVPYGGAGYNGRDLGTSIEQMSSPAVVDFFARCQVENLDFESLFDLEDYFQPGDFIFCDPPYDSAFSTYNDDGGFGPDAQQRLADALGRVKGSFMLVVKNTPFMLELYRGRGFEIGVFDKTYQANFRNRHSRQAEHLVAANYCLGGDDVPGLVMLERCARPG